MQAAGIVGVAGRTCPALRARSRGPSDVDAEVRGDAGQAGCVPLSHGTELPLGTVAVELTEVHRGLGGRILGEVVPGEFRAAVLVDDLKTLAAEASVTRTAFYPKKNRDGTTRPGPYQHLAEEFERRLRTLQEAGEVIDPRTAQIERFKAKVTELKERLAQRDETIAELTTFKELALSRLAAQHDEIVRLRQQAAALSNVRRLPAALR